MSETHKNAVTSGGSYRPIGIYRGPNFFDSVLYATQLVTIQIQVRSLPARKLQITETGKTIKQTNTTNTVSSSSIVTRREIHVKWSECKKICSATGPTGELTALPGPPSWILGEIGTEAVKG